MWYFIGFVLLAVVIGGIVWWRRRTRPATSSDDLASQTQQRLRWLNSEFIKYLEAKETELVQRMARGTSGPLADESDPLHGLPG